MAGAGAKGAAAAAAAAGEVPDYYGLLGVGIESSVKEIAAAYRRAARKVHPDKNPDDPKAAVLFHELSRAYDILSDPAKRTEYDASVRAKLERRKRHEQLDSKRRKLKDDLLERELAAKELREREQESRRELDERMSRMRNEGLARQQEEEDARARALFEQAARDASPEPLASALLDQVTELDKTLKVKWDPARHPHTEATLRSALASFGAVDSLVLSSKRPGTAVAAYESIVSAETAPELAGLQLRWAQGTEPAILARLPELASAAAIAQARTAIRAAAEAAAPPPAAAAASPATFPAAVQTPAPARAPPSLFAAFASATPTPATAFAAAAANKDYENLTLMRMRQAQERQRIIAEMQARGGTDD